MSKNFTHEEAELLAKEIKETYGLYASVSDTNFVDTEKCPNYSFVGIYVSSRALYCVATVSTMGQFESLKAVARVLTAVDDDLVSIEHHKEDGLIEEKL